VAAPAIPAVAPGQPAPKIEPTPEKKLKLAAEPATPVAAPAKQTVTGQKPGVAPAAGVPVNKPGDAGVVPARKKEEQGEAKPVPSVAAAGRPVTGRAPRVTIRQGGLALANRVLGLVVLVLLVLVVYSVASIQADVAEEVAKQVAGAGTFPLAPLIVTSQTVPSLDYYLEKVSRRNIFARLGPQFPPVTPIKDMGKAADLKLVGVSLDTVSPEESLAIIRSKPDSKMHFVKLGQAVGDTGLTLERVLPDRVILKGNKQEFELK
jgi:hypothetical protein